MIVGAARWKNARIVCLPAQFKEVISKLILIVTVGATRWRNARIVCLPAQLKEVISNKRILTCQPGGPLLASKKDLRCSGIISKTVKTPTIYAQTCVTWINSLGEWEKREEAICCTRPSNSNLQTRCSGSTVGIIRLEVWDEDLFLTSRVYLEVGFACIRTGEWRWSLSGLHFATVTPRKPGEGMDWVCHGLGKIMCYM